MGAEEYWRANLKEGIMRNSFVVRFFMVAAVFVAAAMSSNQVAAQCDPNPCPEKQICKFGACRTICCSDTECTADGEACYRKVCMPSSEVETLKSRVSATARKAAEQAQAEAEAKAKAETEAREAAEQAQAEAEAKAKAETEAREAAEQAQVEAEAERKLALAKAKKANSRGPVVLALEIAFPLALPGPYDPQSVYLSGTFWGGWMFNAEGWWGIYLLGGVGGGKIPGPEDAGAYHFGASAGGVLRPCDWFFFKGGGGYLLKTPRYQEYGIPDSQGFLNMGVGFELAKKLSLEPAFGWVVNDQFFGSYPAFVFTASGHIPLP